MNMMKISLQVAFQHILLTFILDFLQGDLLLEIHRVKGLQRPKNLSVAIEVDRYGMFYKALQTREIESVQPEWNDHFVIDLQSRFYQ